MSLKSLWHHYSSSDLNLSKEDSRYRRVYLINTLSLLMIAALIFYIIFNVFYSKLFILAFTEGIALIVTFIPLFILRKYHNVELAASILTLNLFILMLLFIYTQNHHDYAFAQAIFLPILAIFLKGKKVGLIYSFLFIGSVLTIAYSGIGVWDPMPFTTTAFINLFTSYLFVLIMLYYFESSRKEAFDFIKQASEREYQNNLKLREKSVLLNHSNELLSEYKSDLESKVDKMLERKRTQDQILIQQSKMAAMGEMMAAITHQWKQPLSTISTLISTIKIEDALSDAPRVQSLSSLDDIEEQLSLMKNTINDFSNFFKPLKIKESFSLPDLVSSVVSLMQTQFNASHVTIITEFEDPNLMVKSYKNEFIQVLLILFSNAKDAINEAIEKGSLKKSQGRIKVKAFQEKGDTHLLVEDNGGGIAPEVLPLIFDPYFTTKPDGLGTGIGLYMSHFIVTESMEGTLTARNGDEGAVFSIIF